MADYIAVVVKTDQFDYSKPYVKDSTYVVPKHVGKEGAKEGDTVADGLLVYNVTTKNIEYDELTNDILQSINPGVRLCKYLGGKYRNSIIITGGRKLRIAEDGGLEGIVDNEFVDVGKDAKAALKEAIRKYFGDETAEEADKEYNLTGKYAKEDVNEAESEEGSNEGEEGELVGTGVSEGGEGEDSSGEE